MKKFETALDYLNAFGIIALPFVLCWAFYIFGG